MKNPMHPGEFIQLAYMEPLELQTKQLAEKLCISPSTLSRIINKKIDVSYEMALRLSIVLGRSPESWISIQTAYSLAQAKATVEKEPLQPIVFA